MKRITAPAWQHIAQSANAVVEVARLRRAALDQARADGHTVVEVGDEILVNVDYSDIETRVLAHYTKD